MPPPYLVAGRLHMLIAEHLTLSLIVRDKPSFSSSYGQADGLLASSHGLVLGMDCSMRKIPYSRKQRLYESQQG
jgi:hypothetical protein